MRLPLADRFKLVMHHESASVAALVISGRGPTLTVRASRSAESPAKIERRGRTGDAYGRTFDAQGRTCDPKGRTCHASGTTCDRKEWTCDLIGTTFHASGRPGDPKEGQLHAKEAWLHATDGDAHAGHRHSPDVEVLGETDKAMAWLERSADTGFPCWSFFRIDPHLESLREEPAFKRLVEDLEQT